jgi:cytochrome c biogenesis protein CcdA
LGLRVLPAELTKRIHEGGERGLSPDTGPELVMPRRLALAVGIALVAALLVPEAAVAATSLNQVVENLRNWISGLMVAVGVCLLTVAGFRYVISSGDPGQIERAKSAFKAALCGFALAALAPAIIAVLQHIVG